MQEQQAAKSFIQAVKGVEQAMISLRNNWDEWHDREGVKGYPFHLSLDEMCLKVCEWADTVTEHDNKAHQGLTWRVDSFMNVHVCAGRWDLDDTAFPSDRTLFIVPWNKSNDFFKSLGYKPTKGHEKEVYFLCDEWGWAGVAPEGERADG